MQTALQKTKLKRSTNNNDEIFDRLARSEDDGSDDGSGDGSGDEEERPITQIGNQLGEAAVQLTEELVGSAQDIIGLFTEVVSSVGEVLENVSHCSSKKIFLQMDCLKNSHFEFSFCFSGPASQHLALLVCCYLVAHPG